MGKSMTTKQTQINILSNEDSVKLLKELPSMSCEEINIFLSS